MVGRKQIRGREHGMLKEDTVKVLAGFERLLMNYFPFPGLERTDNDLENTSWPQVAMINQKNYYT